MDLLFDNNLLLIGNSKTSQSLWDQLHTLTISDISFHSCSTVGNLRSKLNDIPEISVVIIDVDDKNLDIFEIAKIIETFDDATRILVCTKREYSPRFYQELINTKFVRGLIEVPIDNEELELLITLFSAKYTVLKIMKEDISSSSIAVEQKKYANIFSGFVFTIYSLVKYAIIQDVVMREKEILIGSYLSSILDIMAPEHQTGTFTEFKLGKLEIISYNEDYYDYFFMFNDLSPTYREHLRQIIPSVIDQMKESVGEYFFDPNLVFDTDKEKIELILNNNNLKLEQGISIFKEHRVLVVDRFLPLDFLKKEFEDTLEFVLIEDRSNLFREIELLNPSILIIDVTENNFENRMVELYHISSQFPHLHFILSLREVTKDFLKEFFKVDLNISIVFINDRPAKIASVIHVIYSSLLTHELETSERHKVDLPTFLRMKYNKRNVEKHQMTELVAVQVLLDGEVIYSIKMKDEDIFENTEIKNIVQSFKSFGSEITETNNIFSINIDKYTIYFMVILSYDILFVVESDKVLLANEVGLLINEYNQEIVSLVMEHMVNQNEDFYEKMNYLVDEIRVRFCTYS